MMHLGRGGSRRALVRSLREEITRGATVETEESSSVEQQWIKNDRRIRQLIATSNPDRFCEWDVVRDTMFVGPEPYVGTEFRYLVDQPNWATRWRSVLQESRVGRPPRYQDYRRSSSNLIHHAYHLARFEREIGVSVTDFRRVIEFGGGYGSMCRLFYNLGFSGKYFIHDLPSLCSLQKYFLARTLRFSTAGEVPQVSFLSGLKELQCAPTDSPSLFLATWSISEVPLELRQAVFAIAGKATYFLLAFQKEFGNTDNFQYFDAYVTQHSPSHKWKIMEISHLPGNYYLFGSAR